MHSDPTLAEDACLSGLGAEGLSPTEFTLGGVCRFRPVEGESAAARAARGKRDGYYGWMGYGGSEVARCAREVQKRAKEEEGK